MVVVGGGVSVPHQPLAHHTLRIKRQRYRIVSYRIVSYCVLIEILQGCAPHARNFPFHLSMTTEHAVFAIPSIPPIPSIPHSSVHPSHSDLRPRHPLCRLLQRSVLKHLAICMIVVAVPPLHVTRHTAHRTGQLPGPATGTLEAQLEYADNCSIVPVYPLSR